MGEGCKDAQRLSFDRRSKPQFHGTKVTSDAGLPTHRELDETLELTRMAGSAISENRTGGNTSHGIGALLRQSIYRRSGVYKHLKL